MEHQFTVEIQIWPLDHNLGQIWPLDHIINVGIVSGPLDQRGSDLGRQIALERGAKYLQKVGDLSAIFCGHRRLFGEIVDLSVFTDISLIYWRFIAKNRPSDFSLGNVVSPPPDTRYIGDISPIYPDIFLHQCQCGHGYLDRFLVISHVVLISSIGLQQNVVIRIL